MRISRHGYRELLVLFLACLALFLLSIRYVMVLAPVPVGLFLFFLSFFRDPERKVPSEDGILVSPADGTVADIQEVQEEDELDTKCLRIGIFLSVFNVHVNRSPGTGRVEGTRYENGSFHNAMSEDAAKENESNTIHVRNEDSTFLVKQIAGLLARRIVCTLQEGDRVARGERIGMIKFGSRTELYVPLSEDPTVNVEEGDGVTGGETILVQFEEEQPS
jgi:phosphatidylserine decarboxylase